MKSLQFLLVITLSLAGINISAQENFIRLSGSVKDIVTEQPVANQMMVLTCHPDTSDYYTYSDTAFTDDMGWYSFPASVPVGNNPSAVYIRFSTLDCMNIWRHHTVLNDGLGGFSTVFEIFSDCNNLPGACENKIYPIVTGHSAFLAGLLFFGQPATYSWDFGDGNTATGAIVEHTYSQIGNYNVVLQTITQDSCIDSSSVSVEISDSIPPASCSNSISAHCNGLDVSFNGYIGTGQTASFYWDFGDGSTDSTASGQFVQHQYAQKGFYNIVLQTITPDGCVSYSGYPLALIDSLDQSACNNFILPGDIDKLTVSLHGYLYNGKPASYFWNFGDGTTATTQYVTHTFA